MDEQIAKKQLIFNELNRKFSEGVLTQPDVVDLSQEFQRCNHILKHIIRGQENPSARWITSGLFTFVGFLVWSSYRVPPARGQAKRVFNFIVLPAMLIVPGIIGYTWGGRRFGNKKEAIRFRKLYEQTLETDKKFYELTNNLKFDSLKHI